MNNKTASSFVARALLLGALCVLFISPALAQSQTGAVTGHIRDASTQNPLLGAEVSISGIPGSIYTEHDGSYRIGGVPQGTHQMTVSYLGYQTVTKTVEMRGERVVMDVLLGTEIMHLDKLVVEGAREGQARAINQQRAAGNIINSVAADAIGNFPDRNVAESLQRIPGISTESVRGEPRFITIRGAAPGQNAVTLDGMTLLGAEQDFRAVSLDVFPSAQISAVEVVKAVTPDLDGDSIGGAVVLRGKSAFDTNRLVATANVSYTYNDLAEKDGWRGAVTFGTVFGAKKDWGVNIAYSYENFTSLQQNIETNGWTDTSFTASGKSYRGFVPTTLLQTNVTVEKTRQSLSGAIEKKFGHSTRVFIRGFSNEFEEYNNRDGLRYAVGINATGGGMNTASPITISDDGTFTNYTATKISMRRQIQPRTFDDTSRGLIGGIEFEQDNWGFDIALGYTRATEDLDTTQGQWNSKSTANTAAVDQSDRYFWRVSQTAGTSMMDPATLAFNQLLARKDRQQNEETTLKLDAYRRFTVGEAAIKLSGGAKFRWNEKLRANTPVRYDSMRSGTLDFNDPRLGGNIVVNTNYLDRYDFGLSLDATKMADFFNANRAAYHVDTMAFDSGGLFNPNIGKTYNNSMTNRYTIDEDISAGYLRFDWTYGKWSAIAGARLEHTALSFDAYTVDATKAETDKTRYQPYHLSSDYNNLLPAAHVRYEATKRLIFRGAWTNTIARPSAPDMIPAFSVNSIDKKISGGNPDLKAVKSMNWDLMAEYYLSSVGILSAGVFYKTIKGPIYDNVMQYQYDGEPYEFSTKQNAGDARLLGLELSYQQQLRFLPSPFDGLGVYANYTLTDSDVDVPMRPGENFTLFKQSKWLGNAAIFYQKYGISARIAYTFRSGYLTELLTRGTDTYFDVDHRLDMQISYKFLKHWTVTATATNLENTPELQYHGTRSRLEFYGLTGRFFSLGISCEF